MSSTKPERHTEQKPPFRGESEQSHPGSKAAQLGRLDIIVNNAAYQGGKTVGGIADIEAERVERTFKVNIVAMFHIVRHALPHLRPGSAHQRLGVTGGKPLA